MCVCVCACMCVCVFVYMRAQYMQVCGICRCVCLHIPPQLIPSYVVSSSQHSQPSTKDAAENTAACGNRGDHHCPSPLPPGSARGQHCARNTPGRRDKRADDSIADNACLLPNIQQDDLQGERKTGLMQHKHMSF